jgi:hypothetical protein
MKSGIFLGSLSSFVLLGSDGFDVEVVVLSFRHFDELSFSIPDIILSWSVNVVFVVIQELAPVGNPSDNSGNCEEYGVHVGWEAHGSVDESTVKVNVGVKFSGDKVFVLEGDFFEFKGDFDQGLLSADLKHFESNLR